MAVSLEKTTIPSIPDQVPTQLEVIDPPVRMGDETGKNYAEAFVTGYIIDPEDPQGPEKIMVGTIEAGEGTMTLGEGKEAVTKEVVLVTAAFMLKEVFGKIVELETGADNHLELIQEAHDEAKEFVMSKLYQRLGEESVRNTLQTS